MWSTDTRCIFSYSFVHFDSVAECKKSHDAAQGKVVRGQQLLVQYAKKRKEDKKKAKKEAAKKG